VNCKEIRKDDMNKFTILKERIVYEIEEYVHVSYFNVNCKEIRKDLLNIFNRIIELETNILIDMTKDLKNLILSKTEESKGFFLSLVQV
jgi:hypothetical protein